MAAQCATDSPHNPLWDFALALYDRLGVKDVLLRLQDEADMDVLILLADRWLAQQQLNWPAAESLEDYRRWRDAMIVPLRALRRRCGQQQQPLYGQLLQAELSAERQGLNLLYTVLQSAAVQNRAQVITDNRLLDFAPAFYAAADLAGNKKEAVRPLFQHWLTLASQ
ncbi:TIGR02444 family protein [Venatoribacter cucullus]|uniref:TIGR02444 family protein n=1 Tax=Venatoribacter cucullus TaxID=2661630 RepID=A0A9X7V007_9GAMM|nr:TIGR02444 family protein [Venatoribacter cucullus]QQD25330.1 TIGR02444 family protein [Venatoribacter cucullus]